MLIKGNQVVNADKQAVGTEFILTGSIGEADTGGGVISLANPFEDNLLVTDVIIDVTTKSTGACTLDVGVGATATTVADTLIDGVDVGTATIIANSQKHAGTNGVGVVSWSTSQYLTASMKTGAAAGLVGTYTIKCIAR